jgi:hypothetical protein
MVAGDLLYTTEGSGGAPVLNAWNKLTGEYVGQVEMPGSGQYGMMTYSHDGQQTIVVQVGQPARLVALRLPASGGGGRGGGGRGGGPGGL